MERRVVIISERAVSSTVNGISRIESQSIPGIGLLRVYFQPGTDIGAAIAQIGAVSQTILRITPPGMTPPIVIQFNASNLPVVQMTLESETLPEEKIFDYALNFIRIKLFTIPGLSARAIRGQAASDQHRRQSAGLVRQRAFHPPDIVTALQASNIILPAGQRRASGTKEYNVLLNSSPVDGRRVQPDSRSRSSAAAPFSWATWPRISDSFADQENVVRVNGHRTRPT